MSKSILIVDDEPDIIKLISDILSELSFNIIKASTVNEALDCIEKKSFDIALLDVSLDETKRDGVFLLKTIKDKLPEIQVIMMSGHANIQIAVDAMKLGAFEFIEKPFSEQRLINFIKRASEILDLKTQNKELKENYFKSYEFIGNSPSIKKIKNSIDKIALTDSRALIIGPSGSGKELLARKIHLNSKRKDNPFIVLNAATINPLNYEIELFGQVKDNLDIFGLLDKANNGTLLIDNVLDLPLEIQGRILRVFTDQKFKRVNGTKIINVDIRLICTSSIDLYDEIQKGNFREDLFHRINVFNFELPPLKRRLSDINLLSDYFIKEYSVNLGKKFNIKLDKIYELFYQYDWPGNVRELRNIIERILILGENDTKKILNIVKESFGNLNVNKSQGAMDFNLPLKKAREQWEKVYLSQQLKINDGNISKTSKAVGMERSALHRKLSSLGIKI